MSHTAEWAQLKGVLVNWRTILRKLLNLQHREARRWESETGSERQEVHKTLDRIPGDKREDGRESKWNILWAGTGTSCTSKHGFASNPPWEFQWGESPETVLEGEESKERSGCYTLSHTVRSRAPFNRFIGMRLKSLSHFTRGQVFTVSYWSSCP